MSPEEYDAWYRSPRGSWIGEVEYRLLKELLRPPAGASILDVGCGTGYFTRRFAKDGMQITGVDPSPAMIAYAQSHRIVDERYLIGDARALPFPDGFFDCCVAVTSLCFIPEQKLALSEMVRVTRSRFAIGLLNRNSLLYWQKGRGGGKGAYHGAHWHTAEEARRLFSGLPVANLSVQSAIYLPNGSGVARVVEEWLNHKPALGAFLVVTGNIG